MPIPEVIQLKKLPRFNDTERWRKLERNEFWFKPRIAELGRIEAAFELREPLRFEIADKGVWFEALITEIQYRGKIDSKRIAIRTHALLTSNIRRIGHAKCA